MNNFINRREFLKKSALASWSVLLAWFFGKKIYDSFMEETDFKENAIELPVRSLKDKPIDLWYYQYVEDKKILLKNMPKSKFNIISRVSKCLRRKPITDAVEDRYGIPRWLLMAMMAQEWMWDPTMPNLPTKGYKYGDGWLGLIHIQAANAHDFGLKTLPRSTNKMADRIHWKAIIETIDNCNYDMSKLVEYDDRFHPVLAVDCAARFLMNCRNSVWNGTDDRIRAFAKYSWREYSKIIKKKNWEKIQTWYGFPVIEYRSTINNIIWDWFPNNFSKNIYKDIENCKKNNLNIKDRLNDLKFEIDGEESWYDEYLAYFEETIRNFELDKYVDIWSYQDSLDKTRDKEKWNKIQKGKEKGKGKEKARKTPTNSFIKSEFVDTKRHNSQWYRLFRYKVLQWDSPLWISDKFDSWDKQRGDKYANTWDLNVVRYDGKTANNLKPGEIIYVKVKNR